MSTSRWALELDATLYECSVQLQLIHILKMKTILHIAFPYHFTSILGQVLIKGFFAKLKEDVQNGNIHRGCTNEGMWFNCRI
ncbi:hypothetical protein GCM10011409_23270 [Lentibacillus populi]|uniref:Uncharacterized protein n=1 Tax=Lentibacillus populi TaxID=1827502 RepID=A0A9W5TYF3_9BACI|nr:hypothetical protein GCM10011409_23270 [Lentibacillus populi]